MKAKITMKNVLIPLERNDYVQYGSCNILFLRGYDQCQFFFKLVKCQDQKIKYLQKDLITKDIHVKYQSSSTHYSKSYKQDLSFKKVGQTFRSRLQGQK